MNVGKGNRTGPNERASERAGWETVPRRELWAWAWLTVCIVWLVYSLLRMTHERWWEVLFSACFAAVSGYEVFRARKNRKREGERRSEG